MASGVGSRSGIEAGRAYVSLGIFSAEFEKGLRGAQQKMDAFGTKLTNSFNKIAIGAGLAFAGISVGLRTITKEAVQLHRMSKAMGVSIEMLSGMRYQAQLLNVSMEDIDSGLTQFRNRLTQASMGSLEAIRNFESIGVVWQDLIKLSPEEQIYKLGDAFSRLNEVQKLGAARIFGDVGRKIFPVVEALRGKIDEAKKLGIGMSDAQVKTFLAINRSFVTLYGQGMSAAYEAVVQLAPVIKELAIAFGFVVKWIRQFIQENPKLSSVLMYSLGTVTLLTGSLTILGHTIKLVASGMSPFISVIGFFTKKVKDAKGELSLFGLASKIVGKIYRTELKVLKMPFNLLNSAYTKIGSGAKFLGGKVFGGSALSSVTSALQPIMKLLSPIIGVVGPVLGSIGAILGPILAVVGPIVLIGGTIFLIISGLKHIGKLFGAIVDGVKGFAAGINLASGGALKGLLDTFKKIKDIIVGMMARNKWEDLWTLIKTGGSLVLLQIRDSIKGLFSYALRFASKALFDKNFWSSGFAVVWSAFIEGFWGALDIILTAFRTVSPKLASWMGIPASRTTVTGKEYKESIKAGKDPFTGEEIGLQRLTLPLLKEYSKLGMNKQDIGSLFSQFVESLATEAESGLYGSKAKADSIRRLYAGKTIDDLKMDEESLEYKNQVNPMILGLGRRTNDANYPQVRSLEHQKMHLRAQKVSDKAIIAAPTTGLQEKIDQSFSRTSIAIDEFLDNFKEYDEEIRKDLAESGGDKPAQDTAVMSAKLKELWEKWKFTEEELKDLGVTTPPPLPSPEEMKREFESYGTFSAFGLGQIGFGTSVQEKIASGIEKLVDGQSETNSILSNMEQPAFGG